MSLNQLVDDLREQGAFMGFEIPKSNVEAHFEQSLLATSNDANVHLVTTVMRTTDPNTAMLLLTTDGCRGIVGKEMLNCIPVRRDMEDDRDSSTLEYRAELGENVLLHLIQGMIDRNQQRHDEIAHYFIGMLITMMFEKDEDDLKVVNGKLALSDGGKLLSAIIGEGVTLNWGDKNDRPRNEVAH